MKAGYDARFPVYAVWSLEFVPTNIAVVFIQPRSADFLIVGSLSRFFTELAHVVADVATRYPWRTAVHILPFERPPGVWAMLFGDLCIFNCQFAPEIDPARRTMLLQRLLSRVSIDTAARPWDAENNGQLLDSLNGYRVKEFAHEDGFSSAHLASHEQFLVRPLEVFAAWEFKNPPRVIKREPLDYSKHDRAVIAGGGRA
jgi:hypothetical protein